MLILHDLKNKVLKAYNNFYDLQFIMYDLKSGIHL